MKAYELIEFLNTINPNTEIEVGAFCECGYSGYTGKIYVARIENGRITLITDEDGKDLCIERETEYKIVSF